MNLQEVGSFVVSLPSIQFQLQVGEAITSAEALSLKAFENYALAEGLLLNTLGIASFTLPSEIVNIKSFKDSFGVTGRLYAEHY